MSAGKGVVAVRLGSSKGQADADVAQLDSITRHFQALIAGYEARVV